MEQQSDNERERLIRNATNRLSYGSTAEEQVNGLFDKSVVFFLFHTK